MLSKYWLKKEIGIIHLFMIITSKIMVLISIVSMMAGFTLPYTYLILIMGVFILVPALLFLFEKEENLEHKLELELKKITRKEKKKSKRKKN